MSDIKYEGTIVDWDDRLDPAERPRARLTLKTTSSAWWIYADGYEGLCGSCPVVEIEMDHGVLTVRIWADRKEEETTHIISVEGMRRDCPAILRPRSYDCGMHWYPDEYAIRHAKGMWPFTNRWTPGPDDGLDSDEDEAEEESDE